jgi:hypothetical protein
MLTDTGCNISESRDTLALQQRQLLEWRRPAQMFPEGTDELPLPDGFERIALDRGVFHFNPSLISREEIMRLSNEQRENEILALGPFNKLDVFARMELGERLIVIVELSPDGIEIKAAAGTESTLPAQYAVFEATRFPDSTIQVKAMWDVLSRRAA